MELWHGFDLSLTVEDVLRGEGADQGGIHVRRPALIKAASTALHKGTTKLHPAVLISRMKAVEHRHARIRFQDGEEIASSFVASHLAGANLVYPVVCTIGPGLEELASSCMKEDPLLGLALDGLGNAAMEILSQQICGRIGDEARSIGLTASAPLSPGAPGWPVEIGQPQIFSLLDTSQAGITLTTGGMMIPKKSISFVVGIGLEMAGADLCELCNLKERCRYRHV